MSYSYIQSVFPEFDTNSSVYDSKLYNSITLNENKSYKLEANDEDIKTYKTVTFDDKIERNDKVEKFESNVMSKSNEESKNNLKYYNIPVEQNTFNKNKNDYNEREYIKRNRNNILTKENFENNNTDNIHNINHVLNCPECKSIIMKQLNIESDRIRNEEMMELVSYMIFAILILIIFDTLQKK